MALFSIYSDLYETAEKVPNLELLQSYRLDDLNCSKLYSNPGMFFDIWKEEVIEKAKKEAKALRRKNKKKEKQNIRKEIQAGDLTKIETRAVRFFIFTKHWGAFTNYVDKILFIIVHLPTPC
jgi:hypothetical protein